PRPLVLGAAIPLPHAVLLTVYQRRVRCRLEQPGHLVRQGAADYPVCDRLPAVRARLPAHLLLLPAGLLPGVLAGARPPRPARAARHPHRREAGPPDHSETAPLTFLPLPP